MPRLVPAMNTEGSEFRSSEEFASLGRDVVLESPDEKAFFVGNSKASSGGPKARPPHQGLPGTPGKALFGGRRSRGLRARALRACVMQGRGCVMRCRSVPRCSWSGGWFRCGWSSGGGRLVLGGARKAAARGGRPSGMLGAVGPCVPLVPGAV